MSRPFVPAYEPAVPRAKVAHAMFQRLVSRDRYRAAPNSQLPNQRLFYHHVYPNKTHYQIADEPAVAIRKFSPDGKYLITFSRSPREHSVCVYSVRSGFRRTNDSISNAWSHYFKLHFKTIVSYGQRIINKDFLLFANGSQYLLLATTEHNGQEREGFLSGPKIDASFIQDTTLYVVRMLDGAICDNYVFEHDSITLAHNAGINLYGDMLAVMTLLSQEIHLFQIKSNGSLLVLQTIGSACFADDHLYLSQTQATTIGPAEATHTRAATSLSDILQLAPRGVSAVRAGDMVGQAGTIIGGLKHRLLAFLWRQASDSLNPTSALRYFYYHFESYKSLCMWRMQILDDQHFLIKYGSREHVASKPSDSVTQAAYFVVYNFITTEVLNVYENDSVALLKMYERHADLFRQFNHSSGIPMTSSPSNSIYTREAFRRQLYSIRTARNGGNLQSIRRGLGVLPVASQNYRESPYFDMSLYSYDEKCVSHTDRLKNCTDFPAKFYSRVSGKMTFTVQPGRPNTVVTGTRRDRKLASFVFHPYLPVVISVQHMIDGSGGTASLANIHIRV